MQNAAAAGIVLVVMTLVMNGMAIWLRYRLRRTSNGEPAKVRMPQMLGSAQSDEAAGDLPTSAPAAPLKAEATSLDFYYGDVSGAEERHMPIAENQVTALDRSVRLRQVHVPALLQPDARPVRGQPLRGRDHACIPTT